MIQKQGDGDDGDGDGDGDDGDHNFDDKPWGKIAPAHVLIMHPHSHRHV